MSQLGRSKEARDRFYDERVEPGMRAVTIAVSGVDGICGFLRQGNRVDVVGVHSFISTSDTKGRSLPGQELEVIREQTYAKVVLQNMEILVVADDTEAANGPNPGTGGDGGYAPASGEKPSEGAHCPDAAADNGEVSSAGVRFSPTAVKLVTFLATPVQAEKLALLSLSSDVKLIVRSYGDGEVANTRGESSKETIYGPDDKRYHHVSVFRGRKRKTETFSIEDSRNPSKSVQSAD